MGLYKNIYNLENFYVGKDGMGVVNNWGDGYQSGEVVCEDIMEMIDWEVDGSDFLEVYQFMIKFIVCFFGELLLMCFLIIRVL